MRTRAPYTEHCPECDPAVPCRPLSVRPGRDIDGVSARYRCPVCLYSWQTGWQREPEPERRYR